MTRSVPGTAEETWPLTAGIARGDETALGRFYDLWLDRVLATARMLTGRDESFCLDVVQDTMLRVARRMPKLRSEAAVGAWMGRTVRRTAIDRLRAEARRCRHERAAAAAESDPRADGAVRAADAESVSWLQAQLDALAAQDRALLAARFEQGRTLAETGRAVGTSGHAAHGRIRRLLARLRRAAEEAFDER